MNTIISQALATGLPVIATNHSGLPEQVIDGNNGFVVPEGDFHALADSILLLMENDELWPEMGRFGRSHVEENYDSKKLIDRQLECYNDLVCSCDKRSRNRSENELEIDNPTIKPKKKSSEDADPSWTQENVNAIWSDVWSRDSSLSVSALFESQLFVEGCAAVTPYIQNSAQSFLEVASGTGRYGLWFAREHPDCQFMLTDISNSSLSLVNRYAQQLQLKNVTVQREDVRALSFKSESFDVVFSDASLQYLPDPDYETAIQELIRVLRPGGRLVVSGANLWNLPYTFTKLIQGKNYPYGYERSFSPRKYGEVFRRSGAKLLALDGFFPAYSIIRLKKHHAAFRHIGRIANAFSNRVDKLTRRACSRYFGCFVFAVATKTK
jgi:SAM-dependent methyltransferase